MKVLLDTNIIIHRETHRVINYEIGQLFYWLDKLGYEKYIHHLSVDEISGYSDSQVVETFEIKMQSYNILTHDVQIDNKVEKVGKEFDRNKNDEVDTALVNEVFIGRVDLLISEDKKLNKKAVALGISEYVYTIQEFLEKVTQENPELINYEVLSVKKIDFGEVDITAEFFDTFREDYTGFDKWFLRKSESQCYVCYSGDQLAAFLYIKIETESEDYSDIKPNFEKKRRLKIGTLKVASNGYKIGERFLKIVFDNAHQYDVEEIYVTVFDKRPEQIQLIEMLKEWGFESFGIKSTENGEELVLTRPFGKSLPANIENPKFTYPYFSWDTRKFIIKIEPQYHTDLFPDSINTKEDESKYVENKPHRNRIGKVYISHAKNRDLKSGDLALIYRIGETKPKKYSSTVTSICIVEEVITDFKSFDEFYAVCKRRTLIDKESLYSAWWNKYPKYRPFVIRFLHAFSFPTPKPTLHDLNLLGIIPDITNMPLGFIEINKEQFHSLVKFAYSKK